MTQTNEKTKRQTQKKSWLLMVPPLHELVVRICLEKKQVDRRVMKVNFLMIRRPIYIESEKHTDLNILEQDSAE